jgi:hypothetical protein
MKDVRITGKAWLGRNYIKSNLRQHQLTSVALLPRLSLDYPGAIGRDVVPPEFANLILALAGQ